MTMIAYAFLQYRRLKTARREKKNQRAAATTDIARRAPGHPRTHRSTTHLLERLKWAVPRGRYMSLETIAPLSDDPIVKLPAAAA
jgi:hypothetical protein